MPGSLPIDNISGYKHFLEPASVLHASHTCISPGVLHPKLVQLRNGYFRGAALCRSSAAEGHQVLVHILPASLRTKGKMRVP